MKTSPIPMFAQLRPKALKHQRRATPDESNRPHPCKKVKNLYHKVHTCAARSASKGISHVCLAQYKQGTQVSIFQANIFVYFVPTLCSLWLKNLFGVDSIPVTKNIGVIMFTNKFINQLL